MKKGRYVPKIFMKRHELILIIWETLISCMGFWVVMKKKRIWEMIRPELKVMFLNMKLLMITLNIADLERDK